jgi:hypothetical protein
MHSYKDMKQVAEENAGEIEIRLNFVGNRWARK